LRQAQRKQPPGPAVAPAMDFPSRPVEIIVPIAPGGFNDSVARIVAQKMAEAAKRPFVIINRPGAGGTLGVGAVALATPDGHTIGITGDFLAINAALQQKLPYDTLKDLKLVTLVGRLPQVLVTAAGVPAGNLSELIAIAKAKPGSLAFGSSGVGGMPHLAGELLRLLTKTELTHVPYKGVAPMVIDLLAGHLQMAFLAVPSALPHVQGGTLKAIAVAGRERSAMMPNVPTLSELGYAVDAENWYGMIAPAATPPAVVARLHQVTIAALQDAGVRGRLLQLGVTPVGNSTEEFEAYLRSEIEKWSRVVREAGIKRN
jgi:tripartite-type tricarboxylate transporter receptor subunit TctC